jgi:hypothetical protein
MPETHKQNYIENYIIGKFISELIGAANAGKTRYIYTPPPPAPLCGPRTPPPPKFTNEDLIAAFQRKFPDCDISYQEIWDDINATTRVLKKGIVIDWS